MWPRGASFARVSSFHCPLGTLPSTQSFSMDGGGNTETVVEMKNLRVTLLTLCHGPEPLGVIAQALVGYQIPRYLWQWPMPSELSCLERSEFPTNFVHNVPPTSVDSLILEDVASCLVTRLLSNAKGHQYPEYRHVVLKDGTPPCYSSIHDLDRYAL